MGIFDFYDWAADEYKCCNGHVNNRHWSQYCDNGLMSHSLGAGCTTAAMTAGYQTPYQGTSTAYYKFHTSAYPPLASDDAHGDYLFYFR